jgi:hypothetical protein
MGFEALKLSSPTIKAFCTWIRRGAGFSPGDQSEEQDLRECIIQADNGMYLNKQNDRRTRRE